MLPVSMTSLIFYLSHSIASHPYPFTLTSSDQVLVKITSGFYFDRNNEEISVFIWLGPWISSLAISLFPPLFMNSNNLPLSRFHISKLHISETSQFQFSDLFFSLSLLPLQLISFGPMLLNTITTLLTHKFISSTVIHLAFQTYTEMSPQYLYLYFIVVAQSPTCVQFF